MEGASLHFRAVGSRTRQRLHRTQGRPEPSAEDTVKTVDDYLKLPYEITIVRDDEDGKAGWLARVEEVPGCTTRARTPQESVTRVTRLLTQWIGEAIEEGRQVPEPKPGESHSGRLLLRMPQSLHGELAHAAEREQVSLNQFITDALAGAVGWRAAGGVSLPVVRRLDPAALDELDEERLESEELHAPDPPSRSRPRLAAIALAANFALVAVTAAAAVLILITAWK
jgi:antitoxin HicB